MDMLTSKLVHFLCIISFFTVVKSTSTPRMQLMIIRGHERVNRSDLQKLCDSHDLTLPFVESEEDLQVFEVADPRTYHISAEWDEELGWVEPQRLRSPNNFLNQLQINGSSTQNCLLVSTDLSDPGLLVFAPMPCRVLAEPICVLLKDRLSYKVAQVIIVLIIFLEPLAVLALWFFIETKCFSEGVESEPPFEVIILPSVVPTHQPASPRTSESILRTI